MNLPRGIGDPIDLTKRMAARGLIKYPKPETVALEVKLVELGHLKDQPAYKAARVVNPNAPLAERSIKQKR